MKRTMLLSFSIRVLVTIFVTCITGLFQKTSAQEIFSLPFNEGWTSGNFTLNNWQAGQNWVIDGQAGNPKPAAKFKWDPIINNYSSSLESWWIDDSSTNTTTYYYIWLDFDVKLSDRTASGTESLKAEVWNDSIWVTVAEFTNDSSFDWNTKHININSEAKHHAFKIRFVAQGTNSNAIYYWLVDNIKISRVYDLIPPTNFVAYQAAYSGTIPNDMRLYWTAPVQSGGDPVWIHWDNGANYDAIGTGGQADFDIAARFDTDQLNEYYGMLLTKVKFWPNEAGCQYSVRVWQGDMAAELKVDQTVANAEIGQWNEITLQTPYLIDINNELWIGIRCNTTTGYPAGCDAGPEVHDYGQWIYWNGEWNNLVDLNSSLSYNWNIQGCLNPTDDKKYQQSSHIITDQPRKCEGYLSLKSVENGFKRDLKQQKEKQDRHLNPQDLQGYNIYRRYRIWQFPNTLTDWVKINNDPVTTTEYWDLNLPFYCYDYYVTAIYTEGESIPSNIDMYNFWCTNDIDEDRNDELKITPIPATDYIRIEETKGIKSILIQNLIGKTIKQEKCNNKKIVILDITGLQAGTFLMKILLTNNDVVNHKFIKAD